VVVNFGPDGVGHTATLQVDMNQSWLNQSNGVLQVVGSAQPSSPTTGELHGYVSVWGPNPWTRNSFSQNTGRRERIRFWGSPQLLGDWYHCDAGSSTAVNSSDRTYQDAVQYDGTNYVPTSNWPAVAPWDDPAIEPNTPTFDHNILLRFRRQSPTFENDPDGVPDSGDEYWEPPYDPRYDDPNYDDGSGKGKGNSGPLENPPGDTPMSQTAPTGSDPTASTTTGATQWYHTFSGLDMGGDQNPDGHEWRIDVIFKWKTTSGTAGNINCTSATDASGNPLTPCCASCKHDSQGTRKSGYGVDPNLGSWQYWCYLVHLYAVPPADLSLPGASAAPHFQHQGARLPNPVPLDRTCDDCHGCERCDVDGPMFFGGEPGRPSGNWGLAKRGTTSLGTYTFSRGNYGGAAGPAAPEGVNPNTVSFAVFDNVVVRNTKENRTDFRGGGAPVDFEDRFWETNMAYWTGAGSPGFGAVYHRALMELIGSSGTLGTVTWTSYRSAEKLDFEVALWNIPGALSGYNSGMLFNMDNTDLKSDGGTSGIPHGGVYSAVPEYGADGSNTVAHDGVVDGFADNPIGGRAHWTSDGTASGTAITEPGFTTQGILMRTATDPSVNDYYDGLGNATTNTEPSLLVLGIRLAGMPSATDIWKDSSGAGFDPRTDAYYGVETDVESVDATGTAIIAGANGVADGVDRLSVALATNQVTANMSGGRLKANPNVTGGGNLPAQSGAGASAIPQPLLGSPVFEDLTITLILDKPVTIFAEEGGEEGEFSTSVASFYTTGGQLNPIASMGAPNGTMNSGNTVNLSDGSTYTIGAGVKTGASLAAAVTAYDPATQALADLQTAIDANTNLDTSVTIP
jgi:hypothetical protein